MQASDFNAALHEHLRFLQRMRQAAQQTAAYEEAARRRASLDQPGSASGESDGSQLPQTDFALKPGETITLKLGKVRHLIPAPSLWM